MRYVSRLILVTLTAVTLSACSERGARELEAATALGNFELAWGEATKAHFGIPPEVATRLQGKEWLLRRAIAVGSPQVRVAARFVLAHTVIVTNCDAGRELLRENLGDGASERLLEDLETTGCRQYLEESYAATEEAVRLGRIPPNEITDELIERARRQLDRLGDPELEEEQPAP